ERGEPMSAHSQAWPLAVLFAALAGCRPAPEGNKNSPEKGKVVAFVAASTKDAIQEIADAFTKGKGGKVVINADDSSKLAMQIAQDAPAHFFLSANEKWANFIQDKGYAVEVKPLLGNELVLVAPRGNPAGIQRPEDLTKSAVRRLAVAGPTVPAGIYA